MEIKFGNITISNRSKPCFIADIAANHDGDLNRAFKLIELAKQSGADVAKFQNFHANTIVSRNGFANLKNATHQARWKKSVYEVYEDASLDDDWNAKLKEKCDEVGIEYMTSPYDFNSVDRVDPLLNAYKIGSGDITWPGILVHIAKKGKPVLLATGAADLSDVKRAVDCITAYNDQLVLMQCNTNYTASAENFKSINLNVLKQYEALYPDLILGLSDHTIGYATVLGAIALGAVVIEKHFTDDNDRTGPDHKFSTTPAAWKEMVEESMKLWYALGDGKKKTEENEKASQVVQQRAIYTVRPLKKGTVLTNDDLFPLRPCPENGIKPYDMEKVLGKTLARDMDGDTRLTWEDLV